MNTQILILVAIAVVALIVIGLLALIVSLALRSARLKKKYGPEYDYTLSQSGDRKSAEANLKEREKRVVNLDIHPLNEHETERYHAEWREIQAAFVDDPAQAVEKANRMITEVMIARGFPVAEFEQRAADLSVMFPDLVSRYRDANTIAMRNRDTGISTEELRKALVNFHLILDHLLGTLHEVEQVQEPEKQTEAA